MTTTRKLTPTFKIVRASFKQRQDRMDFVVRHFGKHIENNALDVGCDNRYLARLLPELDYTGIDLNDTADLTINLETTPALPFENDSFETVICTDVLEHLDNLHEIFAELIRVCARNLIISLPGNWANARLPIARGRGAIAHYGLPVHKPVDRHKWFFSLEEAQRFLTAQAGIHDIELDELVACQKKRPPWLEALRHIRHPSMTSYLNRYGHTIFARYTIPAQPHATP
ncbi:MAG: class I SAM-dependent methyltransferase [Planctomycetota bacterium]